MVFLDEVLAGKVVKPLGGIRRAERLLLALIETCFNLSWRSQMLLSSIEPLLAASAG